MTFKRIKLKATGLVEVIVVIAILSVVIVSVASVTTKAMRQILKTEIEDRATSIQIRSLEMAKSPSELVLTPMTANDMRNYAVVFSATSGQVDFVERSGGSNLSTNNCSPSSEYYVDLGNDAKDTICNQVIIRSKNGYGGKLYYEVSSVLVFKSVDDFEIKQLLGYRREAIK